MYEVSKEHTVCIFDTFKVKTMLSLTCLHVHIFVFVPASKQLFETSTVMNIDGNGKAATITSKQKRLILQTDGNIPENIRVTHNVSFKTLYKVINNLYKNLQQLKCILCAKF